MATILVDLTAEKAQAATEAAQVLSGQVLPWVVDELRQKWPKDTGLSAGSWDSTDTTVYNPVPYAEHVKDGGRPAVETVIQPIMNQAAERPWQE